MTYLDLRRSKRVIKYTLKHYLGILNQPTNDYNHKAKRNKRELRHVTL